MHSNARARNNVGPKQQYFHQENFICRAGEGRSVTSHACRQPAGPRLRAVHTLCRSAHGACARPHQRAKKRTSIACPVLFHGVSACENFPDLPTETQKYSDAQISPLANAYLIRSASVASPSLRIALFLCVLTVLGVRDNRSQISPSELPSTNRRTTSSSLTVNSLFAQTHCLAPSSFPVRRATTPGNRLACSTAWPDRH